MVHQRSDLRGVRIHLIVIPQLHPSADISKQVCKQLQLK